ncbi:MAG: ATPase [Candidatus Diapherotrites archaeon]|nr:ATPase [Candidatus Diapherotrites archaeon]
MIYSIELERDELGRRLGGGIMAGTITIMEGPDGSGKSVLSQRFTYGLLENGHTVTYISTELSTKDFIRQMQSLGYNILKYLISRRLLFFPVFPPSARKIREKKDLIERLMRAEFLFAHDVTIVDGLNLMIPDGTLPEETLFRFVNFLKKVTQKGRSVVLTYDPDTLDTKVVETLREVADNYLELKSEVVGDDIKNVIYVRRWKSEREVTKVIKFRVEPKFGIVIDISAFAI